MQRDTLVSSFGHEACESELVELGIRFTGVPVADFAGTVGWYERLLGRPADVPVHDSEVMWKLTETSWLYVLADAGRAGHALVTVSVPDIEAALGEIASRGIDPPVIGEMGEAGRKASFLDPEGNTFALIEVYGS